jgi:hypothetical protein
MKPVLFASVVALAALATPATADEVPCENVLADLRAALQDAQPSDADAAKVKELEDKGIERCNADDDKHADEFFVQALKILGK